MRKKSKKKPQKQQIHNKKTIIKIFLSLFIMPSFFSFYLTHKHNLPNTPFQLFILSFPSYLFHCFHNHPQNTAFFNVFVVQLPSKHTIPSWTDHSSIKHLSIEVRPVQSFLPIHSLLLHYLSINASLLVSRFMPLANYCSISVAGFPSFSFYFSYSASFPTVISFLRSHFILFLLSLRFL